MSDFVDRYTPSEPYPRLIVPTVATATFLTLFAFFLVTALNRPGPITDVHVSYLAVPLGMLVAFLASARVAQLAVRDVADRARDADGPVAGTGASETGEASADDPVATLKRRYAAGELSEAEFDRRLERLLETDRTREAAAAPESERLVE